MHVGNSGGSRAWKGLLGRRPDWRIGVSRTPRVRLTIKLDPSTGVRQVLSAKRADAATPSAIELDMEFAADGGEGPTHYEVLLVAALEGKRARFIGQENLEER